MTRSAIILALASTLLPAAGRCGPVGYAFTITTAYATSDPFPYRLDNAFTEGDTGYFQLANTGSTSFSGVIGDIARSAFAGDLSFRSAQLVLAPGQTVSVAIPDDASDTGGFNGPAYDQRPGVEITLQGSVSDGRTSDTVNLMVADSAIHSGIARNDSRGLTSDSYVLQGGDPWGFDTGDAFELSQASGVYTVSQPLPEPGPIGPVMVGLGALLLRRRRRWPKTA